MKAYYKNSIYLVGLFIFFFILDIFYLYPIIFSIKDNSFFSIMLIYPFFILGVLCQIIFILLETYIMFKES